MRKYNEQFYKDRHAVTIHAAETILTHVEEVIPGIKSVIDVGCGVGSWLHVFEQRGVKDILGIDGAWVKKENLKINPGSFMEHDLNQGIVIPRKFDLAISLEVAEHLLPQKAELFVKSLTHLSDIVLFSAAIPGQGGTKHINEQWQDYWVALFNQQGFVVYDFIRRRVWDDQSIPSWYKQNIFLFIKNERAPGIIPQENNEGIPICVIHPELYVKKVVNPSPVQSIKSLVRSVKQFLAFRTQNR